MAKTDPSAAQKGCATVLIVVALLGAAFMLWPMGDESAEDLAACQADLECWGQRNRAAASGACLSAIDNLAAGAAVWDDGTDLKVGQYRWLDQSAGTLTYFGDRIRLPSSSGALIRHRFECAFDPAAERLTDFRIEPVS